MLTLITGGQGFVGSHLCARLLAAGHRVRVLARPVSQVHNLEGLDVEIVRGDLLNGEGLADAVAGVDWVFHLAGLLKAFRREDLLKANAGGTRRMVEACRSHAPGLSRFVLVSSLAASGPSPGGPAPIGEEDPQRPLTWYGQSKLEAERVLLDSGLPCAIVRPPAVFGPRDRDVYGYFRIAKLGLLPVPGRAKRHYSLVYAPDLADGILRVAEAPVPSGEAFHITGPEVVTWEELGLKIAAALGVKGRVLRVPEWLLRAAGRGADALARLRGRPEIFSSQKVIEMLAPAWVASPRKARESLGWTAPTPLDEALALTVRWYREQGWL